MFKPTNLDTNYKLIVNNEVFIIKKRILLLSKLFLNYCENNDTLTQLKIKLDVDNKTVNNVINYLTIHQVIEPEKYIDPTIEKNSKCNNEFYCRIRVVFKNIFNNFKITFNKFSIGFKFKIFQIIKKQSFSKRFIKKRY